MTVINISTILLLAITCNAAEVEISCLPHGGLWCKISKEVAVSDTDNIKITNADPKENVTTFTWDHPSNIKTMPSVWFDTFPNLESCELIGVGFETVTESSFKNARVLDILRLGKNNISVIPASVFKMAPSLSELYLDLNQIVEMQDWALKGLDILTRLSLNNNKIKALTRNMLAGSPNLKTVFLSSNEIETIEEGSLELPHLDSLLLSTNHIKNLPADVFKGAPLLDELNLYHNLLTSIPDALFRKNNIKFLIMGHNKLKTVSIQDFMRIPSLKFLLLDDTGVQTVWPEDMTDKTTSTSNIRFLDLSNNGINDTNILKQLSGFKHLGALLLDSNRLRKIDVNDIKTWFPSATSISMENNPIDCDWLKESLPKISEAGITLETGNWDKN